MYEPIRTKSVHTMAEPEFPHRSREEELDIQLAGHLAALLAVTDELRAASASAEPDLDHAADRISEQVARLRRTPRPVRSDGALGASGADLARTEALHRRAHALAGRALVVAASRADTAAAILAAERMDAHAAALGSSPAAASPALTAAH
ncbi:SCO4983 family protein [Streptomyces sp. 8N616]|uniref:SCO4983 family protein n=1 Tax=Streptomyces sp. 8N616 TaxID=3457414 RepID=UPI003FD68D4D